MKYELKVCVFGMSWKASEAQSDLFLKTASKSRKNYGIYFYFGSTVLPCATGVAQPCNLTLHQLHVLDTSLTLLLWYT